MDCICLLTGTLKKALQTSITVKSACLFSIKNKIELESYWNNQNATPNHKVSVQGLQVWCKKMEILLKYPVKEEIG